MRTQLITKPAIEPISLATAKEQCRVDATFTLDDDYISSLIVAARQWAEGYTGKSFISQVWELKLDRWHFPIRLQRGPLISVTSITYVDSEGSSRILSALDYQVVASNIPPLIVPSYATVWPSLRVQPDAATVTYVAGYGAAMTDVPQQIRQAIKMLVAHWYEHREPAIVGAPVAQVPMTVESLLAMDRIFNFG
jgi:uncharacterized phiE125 gp8 family phage protein